jgi:hypothetical protein
MTHKPRWKYIARERQCAERSARKHLLRSPLMLPWRSIHTESCRQRFGARRTLVMGQLSSAAFYKGVAAQDSSDRTIHDSASGAVSYDPDGAATAASVQFAQLGAGLNVTARDSYVV